MYLYVYQADVDEAVDLKNAGEQFIEEDHYAVDCIRPKCLELHRMCEQYKALLRTRDELLTRSRELQDRIDRVGMETGCHGDRCCC